MNGASFVQYRQDLNRRNLRRSLAEPNPTQPDPTQPDPPRVAGFSNFLTIVTEAEVGHSERERDYQLLSFDDLGSIHPFSQQKAKTNLEIQ